MMNSLMAREDTGIQLSIGRLILSPCPSRAPNPKRRRLFRVLPGGEFSRDAKQRKGEPMAEAVAAAAGAGAITGGEEHVPDVRFLLGRKKELENREQKWLLGNQNSPLNKDIAFDDKETKFIEVLRKHGFSNDVLKIIYEASAFHRRQPEDIVALIDRSLLMYTAMGRMQRHALFMMLMLESCGKGSKSSEIQVPHRYRDAGQLQGDLKSLSESMKSLLSQMEDLQQQVINAGGVAVNIPEVFRKRLELPKGKKK